MQFQDYWIQFEFFDRNFKQFESSQNNKVITEKMAGKQLISLKFTRVSIHA